MDSWDHALQIVKYMYRLEDQDYLYINDTLTSLFNWIIPSFVAGWLVKRIYIINHPNVALGRRIGLGMVPVMSTMLGATLNYNIYYRHDPKLQQIFLKYPPDTDFKSRKRVNPFKLKQMQKADSN